MNVRTRLLALQIVVVLGLCAFFFFFGLGAFGLVGADEPRYAQIGREMFERHDWIVPTLNGQPWLEKPVLLYWKEINSYMLLGVRDWAARVPAALHATVLVLAVLFFMRRFRPGNELGAALITASCPGVFVFARAASPDMLVSAPFAIAMLSWWAWHRTGKKLWLAVFYALLAVGTLAKGPVAPALALLIVAGYAALRRDAKIFLRSVWLPGFALFFALALPWFVAVESKVPQFFRVFFLEHNLARFGTNLYRHAQPLWFYIPWFLLWVFPWVVFTVPALVQAVRVAAGEVRSKGEKGDECALDREAGDGWLPLFLLLWIAVPIVFFSVSRSKLPGYILPAVPAAAVLTADYLHRRRTVPRLELMLHSLLCGLILAGALLVPWLLLKQPVPEATRTIIAISTGVIAVTVLLAVRRRGSDALHFVTLLPLILGLVFLLRFAALPASDSNVVGESPSAHGLILDITQSARPVDLKLRRLGVKDATPVAVFNVKRDLVYGLNFYRNQPVGYYSEGPQDLPSGVPGAEHVVIAREGNISAVQAAVSPRQVTRLGGFPPQHLEFFLVASAR